MRKVRGWRGAPHGIFELQLCCRAILVGLIRTAAHHEWVLRVPAGAVNPADQDQDEQETEAKRPSTEELDRLMDGYPAEFWPLGLNPRPAGLNPDRC